MSLIDAIKRQREEVGVSKVLPITHLLSPSIFATKQWFIGTTLFLEGIPFVTAETERLNQLNQQVHLALMNLDERFIVYVHLKRRKQNLSLAGEFKSTFAKKVNETYHARFKERPFYKNDLFLTVLLTGESSGKVAKGIRYFNRLSKTYLKELNALKRDHNVKVLEEKITLLQSQLAAFKSYRLGDKDKTKGYSELIAFLSRLVNGGEELKLNYSNHFPAIANNIPNVLKERALYPEGNLSQYLANKQLFFGHSIQFQGIIVI